MTSQIRSRSDAGGITSGMKGTYPDDITHGKRVHVLTWYMKGILKWHHSYRCCSSLSYFQKGLKKKNRCPCLDFRKGERTWITWHTLQDNQVIHRRSRFHDLTQKKYYTHRFSISACISFGASVTFRSLSKQKHETFPSKMTTWTRTLQLNPLPRSHFTQHWIIIWNTELQKKTWRTADRWLFVLTGNPGSPLKPCSPGSPLRP